DLRLAVGARLQLQLRDAVREEIFPLVLDLGRLDGPARLPAAQAAGWDLHVRDERAVVVDAERILGRRERVPEVADQRRAAVRPLPLQAILAVGALVDDLELRPAADEGQLAAGCGGHRAAELELARRRAAVAARRVAVVAFFVAGALRGAVAAHRRLADAAA